MLKVQEAGSVPRLGFALSKRPHLNRIDLAEECKRSSTAVNLGTDIVIALINKPCVLCVQYYYRNPFSVRGYT